MQEIPEDQLISFTFHKDEVLQLLRWEHEGEFEYKGLMYDVVSALEYGNFIRYTCWPDVEESALNLRLQKLVEGAFGSHSNERENQILTLRFFQSLVLNTVPIPAVSISQDGLSAPPDCQRQFLSSLLHSPPTPPPEA